MSNEEIVKEIKDGKNTTDNLEYLYTKNLPLIKQIIKPYANLENEEDLLQECYFGLLKAVENYECYENIKFMTYAKFWIKQSCIRYIENYSKLVRIPVKFSQKIISYKKAVAELSNKLGRYPKDSEIIEFLDISKTKLDDLKKYSQGVKSLNEIYTMEDGGEYEFIDTIKDDLRLEEIVIDNLYDEHCKDELWSIVARHISNRECDILQDRFKKCKSYKVIADSYNISYQRAREIESKALRKLRYEVVKKELSDKFDIAFMSAYRSGVSNFKNTWESSTEKAAFRMLDFEEYKRKFLKKLEYEIRVENC